MAFVLLVEDSEDDAFFFRWALKKAAVSCELEHIPDGGAALEYLKGVREGRNRRPDVVFLDLKLPTYGGFEILTWLNENPISPPLSVSILSGSEHRADIMRGEALGAAGYFVKPIAVDKLKARLEALCAASTDGRRG